MDDRLAALSRRSDFIDDDDRVATPEERGNLWEEIEKAARHLGITLPADDDDDEAFESPPDDEDDEDREDHPEDAAPPPPAARPQDHRPGDASPPRPRLSAPGWTPDRQRGFIEHLAANGCVSHAARAVGLSKQSAYQLRDRTPNSVFALAWDVAIHRSRRLLLDDATERALAGREVPIVYKGQEVGTRIVHNDRMVMFLLSLKREPVHPNLTEHELAELWPNMLADIDAVLPSILTDARLAELASGA